MLDDIFVAYDQETHVYIVVWSISWNVLKTLGLLEGQHHYLRGVLLQNVVTRGAQYQERAREWPTDESPYVPAVD